VLCARESLARGQGNQRSPGRRRCRHGRAAGAGRSTAAGRRARPRFAVRRDIVPRRLFDVRKHVVPRRWLACAASRRRRSLDPLHSTVQCILGCQQSFSLLRPLCCVPWRNSLDTSDQNNRDPSLPCDCVVRLLIVLFVLMKRHTQCEKCFRKREGFRSEIRRKKA
jgi:hypothetical protein